MSKTSITTRFCQKRSRNFGAGTWLQAHREFLNAMEGEGIAIKLTTTEHTEDTEKFVTSVCSVSSVVHPLSS